eukprot:4759684-Prymnesium_polylepis.1
MPTIGHGNFEKRGVWIGGDAVKLLAERGIQSIPFDRSCGDFCLGTQRYGQRLVARAEASDWM